MRTRYVLAILVIPALALLALGALPSLLGGGETYYVVATAVDIEDGEPPAENVTATVDAANLSERRFPYTTTALEEGVSEGYEEGPFGFKEPFTHTPFDEFGEFERWERNATDGDVVYVQRNGTYYRLQITEEPDERSERLERAAGVERVKGFESGRADGLGDEYEREPDRHRERVAGPRIGH